MSRLLRDAATAYTLRHGRAPTLVLDAMDLVAKKDPAFFSEVQDFAKACADGRILRVVFVFSDGDALPLLLSSSAESRCDKDRSVRSGVHLGDRGVEERDHWRQLHLRAARQLLHAAGELGRRPA